jgi:hypothetical protein
MPWATGAIPGRRPRGRPGCGEEGHGISTELRPRGLRPGIAPVARGIVPDLLFDGPQGFACFDASLFRQYTSGQRGQQRRQITASHQRVLAHVGPESLGNPMAPPVDDQSVRLLRACLGQRRFDRFGRESLVLGRCAWRRTRAVAGHAQSWLDIPCRQHRTATRECRGIPLPERQVASRTHCNRKQHQCPDCQEPSLLHFRPRPRRRNDPA